jgi:hypothetical protein
MPLRQGGFSDKMNEEPYFVCSDYTFYGLPEVVIGAENSIRDFE